VAGGLKAAQSFLVMAFTQAQLLISWWQGGPIGHRSSTVWKMLEILPSSWWVYLLKVRDFEKLPLCETKVSS